MYGNGTKKYYGQNPQNGTNIYVSFAKKPEKASLKVFDVAGTLIRELPVKSEVGMQRINWNLTRASAQNLVGAIRGNVDPEQIGRRGGLFGASIAPGQYKLVLAADGKEYVHTLSVEADPVIGSRQIAAGGEDDEKTKDGDDDDEEERHEKSANRK